MSPLCGIELTEWEMQVILCKVAERSWSSPSWPVADQFTFLENCEKNGDFWPRKKSFD
jgi:hypothetical protein